MVFRGGVFAVGRRVLMTLNKQLEVFDKTLIVSKLGEKGIRPDVEITPGVGLMPKRPQ
jgi:hypothetical protein